MATTNCVATFGLVGPRAGISIGICVPETVTEPIPVVRNSANRTTITMTITLRRCRSSSICSKNVIRRSLGRSASEATFATAVIAAKRARLMYFPQMQGCESPSEGVAVLGQRIRGVAVPADLPVPELFLVRERDGAHPLCTLVGVALRPEEPNRGTMPRSSPGHFRTSRCPGGRSLSAAIRMRPLKSLDINRCANVRRGFSAYDSTSLRDATRARVIGRKHEGRVPRQWFNSPTNFPREGHGAGKLRARRDFCCRCPAVSARHVLRHAPVPARPPNAAEGPHLRVRRGPGRRGADPISLPILHVRAHFRHLRRRRDLPPPLGLRVGRPLELGIASGQVLDLPVPRDHVRRHAIRAQEGGGHPDMSAVVTSSPSITGRSVPGAEKEVLAQLKAAFGPKLKDAKVVRERLVEIMIDRAELVPVCTYLKDTLGFEHLSCVTAVDWKDHFESIYHIENYYNGCMVQVNAQIPYDDPKIATLTGLWHAADFLEREMWDLMGVEYTGHPNLTRILLPEDFKFHPLRKEFAQEVDRQYITRRKLRGGK